MEGGFEDPAKKKLKVGEGSGAVEKVGRVVGAIDGDGGSGSVGRGGGSGAVARYGGSGSRGAVWSGGAGGSRGGGSDAAAAAASAEVFVPNKKKRKNRKTRTERGLPSMKPGNRPPAFVEFVSDDDSEEVDGEMADDQNSRDAKSRHVLTQLRHGKWEYQTEIGKYICPFCDNVKATDYDGMVAHAIGIGSGSERRRAHVRAKHAAYGLFLQKIKVE